MHITRVVVKNFRNLRAIDVSTPQQILVGVEITDFYDEEQDEKVKELALALRVRFLAKDETKPIHRATA